MKYILLTLIVAAYAKNIRFNQCDVWFPPGSYDISSMRPHILREFDSCPNIDYNPWNFVVGMDDVGLSVMTEGETIYTGVRKDKLPDDFTFTSPALPKANPHVYTIPNMEGKCNDLLPQLDALLGGHAVCDNDQGRIYLNLPYESDIKYINYIFKDHERKHCTGTYKKNGVNNIYWKHGTKYEVVDYLKTFHDHYVEVCGNKICMSTVWNTVGVDEILGCIDFNYFAIFTTQFKSTVYFDKIVEIPEMSITVYDH